MNNYKRIIFKGLVVVISSCLGLFFLTNCEKCVCNPQAPKLYLYSVDQSGNEQRFNYTEMRMEGARKIYYNENQLPLNGGANQTTFYIKYNAQIDTLTLSYRLRFVELKCGLDYEIVDSKIIEPTTFDNIYLNSGVYVEINN